MKKRNIVRFVAFLLAMLMCLSTGLTLFAEGVDTLELPSASEPASQTASGGNTLARSELGQKILDFKNSDEYDGKYIFDVIGRVENYDDTYNIYRYGEISTDLSSNATGLFGATGLIDGKYALYFKDSDSFKYIQSHDYNTAPYTSAILADSDISKDDCISAFRLKILPSDLTNFSFADYIKDIYICIFDKDSNDIKFVCPYADFIKYSRETTSTYDKSTFTVKTEPIVNESGSVTSVKCTVKYNIDIVLGVHTDIKLKDGLKSFKVLNMYNKTVQVSDITGDYSKNSGEFSFKFDADNGNYTFRPFYNTDYLSDKSISFVIDCIKPEDRNKDIVPVEELEAATVSFSGMPNEAYTNDSVTLKMSTNKKCKMSFNGSYLANNEYATSAEFTVTRNGIYSYTATNERGVATNGTFEVTFFKDRVEDAINDPLQVDLISAKTDSNLSQTGLYQTWLIILAVILCSVGILLIVNQKYHFLDKFVRRFKHESN